MKTYLSVYLGAIILSLFLTGLVTRLARRFRFLDAPHARKVHASPTPRLGGIAIFLSMMCMVIPVVLLHNLVGQLFRFAEPRVIALLIAATIVFLLGLYDDLRGLRSPLKLAGIALAAAVVCASGTVITSIRLGDWFNLNLGIFAWPVTFLWIVGITVGMNFIDGLDGLAAGIAAITCLVIAAIAASYGQMVTAVIALSLLGSLTGFLFHNFHPAKIFMGDCGSMLVGFVMASASVLCASRAQSFLGVLVPALTLSIPIFDAFFTLIRRGILERRPLFAAERGHIHHRLLDMGFKQRQVVLLLYGVTLLSASIGMLMFVHRRSSIFSLGCELAIPLLLFRLTGNARIRKILGAIHRNIVMARSTKGCKDMLAETQLELHLARSFQDWWHGVCDAAQAMGIARLALPLQTRTGATNVLMWSSKDAHLVPDQTLTATVPVRHRRTGDALKCEVAVPAHDSLEMAGRRMMYFSRLVDEYSIAELPHSLHKDRTPPPNAFPTPAEEKDSSLIAHINGKRLGMTDCKSHDAGEITVGSKRRIAVVHDFLYTYAGAERVLEQILKVYPDADVFSLFDFVPEGERGFLQGKTVQTTFLQRMPFARRNHRPFLPLMPLAIEQLDVSAYDIVISSSYLAAKGVLTRADQLHVCYCHTPVRFAWDLQQQYLSKTNLIKGLKSIVARCILHYIRSWDAGSSNRVDRFLTNSQYVARRIAKVYRRDATVIYPPVDIDNYTEEPEKDDFYLTVSRLVPYKRIDMIVEAFSRLKNRRLIVIGDGPEMEKIRAKATSNVSMLGFLPCEHVKEYMQRARAFIFAAEEDFGIVPVEAQACGTPVIAYARGGVTESVIDGRTGTFFNRQTVESLLAAIADFESNDAGWNRRAIRTNAERFGSARFRKEFREVVENEWMSFNAAKPLRLHQGIDMAQQLTGTLGLTEGFTDQEPLPLQHSASEI